MREALLRFIGGIAVIGAGISTGAFAQVVINEVSPGAPEFVELLNAGDAAVDVSGWSVASDGVFTFPRGTTLEAGEYLVLARDPDSLRAGAGLPADVTMLDWADADLGSDRLQLVDASPERVVVDELACASADAAGASLELVNPRLHGMTPRAWRPSRTPHGTPGARNSRFTDAPIVIAEQPPRGSSAIGLTRVSVTFSEPVDHVTASAVVTDGLTARSVHGTGAGPYVFEVSPRRPGTVQVAVVDGAALGKTGAASEGDSWSYLDPPATVLSMPDDARGGPGAIVQVPIAATPGDGILAIDMTILYAPAVMLAQSVSVSGIAAAAGFGLVGNVNTPGRIIISMYATSEPMSGSGEIARIQFGVAGAPGATSALTFDRASINEGAISAVLDHGLFTVTCAGAANGTGCTDANACTVNDQCVNGSCVGTAIQVPGEITGVLAQADKATFVWSPAGGGGAPRHDVVRGNLQALPVGPGGGDEACLGNDLSEASLTDATSPPPGGGFWYLVRGENACGIGTFGAEAQNGVPTATRITSTCP